MMSMDEKEYEKERRDFFKELMEDDTFSERISQQPIFYPEPGVPLTMPKKSNANLESME